MAAITLPYEPNYSDHRKAKARHDEIKRWLGERERLVAKRDVRHALGKDRKRVQAGQRAR